MWTDPCRRPEGQLGGEPPAAIPPAGKPRGGAKGGRRGPGPGWAGSGPESDGGRRDKAAPGGKKKRGGVPFRQSGGGGGGGSRGYSSSDSDQPARAGRRTASEILSATLHGSLPPAFSEEDSAELNTRLQRQGWMFRLPSLAGRTAAISAQAVTECLDELPGRQAYATFRTQKPEPVTMLQALNLALSWCTTPLCDEDCFRLLDTVPPYALEGAAGAAASSEVVHAALAALHSFFRHCFPKKKQSVVARSLALLPQSSQGAARGFSGAAPAHQMLLNRPTFAEPNLLMFLYYDATACTDAVRLQSLKTLCQLIEHLGQVMQQAKAPPDSAFGTRSFVSYSEKLGNVLMELHRGVLHALVRASRLPMLPSGSGQPGKKGAAADAAARQCAAGFNIFATPAYTTSTLHLLQNTASITPYAKLPTVARSFVQQILPVIDHLLLTSPDKGTILCCLQVLSIAAGTKAPFAEFHEALYRQPAPPQAAAAPEKKEDDSDQLPPSASSSVVPRPIEAVGEAPTSPQGGGKRVVVGEAWPSFAMHDVLEKTIELGQPACFTAYRHEAVRLWAAVARNYPKMVSKRWDQVLPIVQALFEAPDQMSKLTATAFVTAASDYGAPSLFLQTDEIPVIDFNIFGTDLLPPGARELSDTPPRSRDTPPRSRDSPPAKSAFPARKLSSSSVDAAAANPLNTSMESLNASLDLEGAKQVVAVGSLQRQPTGVDANGESGSLSVREGVLTSRPQELIRVLTHLVLPLTEDPVAAVRGHAVAAFGNIPIDVLNDDRRCLPDSLFEPLFVRLLQLSRDENNTVRGSVAKVFGTWASSSRVLSSKKREIITSLVDMLSADPQQLHQKAGWALASVSDLLKASQADSKPADTPEDREDEALIRKMVDCCLKNVEKYRNSGKQPWNVVRALGNAAQLHKGDVGPVFTALASLFEDANVKVRWNTAYAVAQSFRNQHLRESLRRSPEASSDVTNALIPVISKLCVVLYTESNFKVRIQACWALSALNHYPCTTETLPILLRSIMQALDQSSAQAVDFEQYKYKEVLSVSLKGVLLHTLRFAVKSLELSFEND
eukprot:gene3317-5199_t